MQISFYHLTQGSLTAALQKLLAKVCERELRAVVVLDSEERVEALNTSLWTLGHGSFLPHGSKQDGAPEKQPIWLTTHLENPNQATVLFLLQSGFDQAQPPFDRCIVLFDGTDDTQKLAAQQAWQKYQKEDHSLTLWSQEKSGEWTERKTLS